MSWHFSRVLVEAFLVATCSDGEPSAQSSGSPTPLLFCAPDRMTAFSRLSRFGMTCSPLTDDRGTALLTWYRAGFPARTSASPARAPASTESDPACGRTWHASLARFDRDTCSWRTLQQSLLGDSDECSVTWPRSGMTADGLCWELPMLGRRTSEIGSGLWPTPSRSDPNLERRLNQGEHYVTATGTVRRVNADGGSSNLGLPAAVRMWPTPTVTGNNNRAGLTPKSGDGLATAVRNWPTPMASDSRGSSGRPKPGKQVQLVDAVRETFATPLSRDYRSGKFSDAGKAHRDSQTRGKPLNEQIGGALNPTWVEWLMGWPLGWTDLKPLETDKFRQWQQPRGACSAELDAA